MTVGEHVAYRLKDLRIHYNSGEGISQDARARELDVAANTISRWETGIHRPSVEDLEKFAHFFGVTLYSFFPAEGTESLDSDLLTLIRLAKNLDADDLTELIKYAEFRKARRMYEGKRRPKAASSQTFMSASMMCGIRRGVSLQSQKPLSESAIK